MRTPTPETESEQRCENDGYQNGHGQIDKKQGRVSAEGNPVGVTRQAHAPAVDDPFAVKAIEARE